MRMEIKAAIISSKAAAEVSGSVNNEDDELKLMGELLFSIAGALGSLASVYGRDCSEMLMERVSRGYVAGQKSVTPEGARKKLELNKEIWE